MSELKLGSSINFTIAFELLSHLSKIEHKVVFTVWHVFE